MENQKKNIAIVCGGDSSEHDVSLRSARGLYSFFDKERYNIRIVDIKGQDWHVELTDGTTACCRDISTLSACPIPQAAYSSRPSRSTSSYSTSILEDMACSWPTRC